MMLPTQALVIYLITVILNTFCKYSLVKKSEKELKSKRSRDKEMEEKIKGDKNLEKDKDKEQELVNEKYGSK